MQFTAQTQKPFTRLYSSVPVDLPYSSAHNTAATQAAYIPPAPRRRAYYQVLHLHRYQIPPPRRTLCRSAQPPIIIRYIRVRRCALLWIHARRRNTSQTMPAQQGQFPTSADLWQVLTRCQQYRSGAPAEGSASPPVHGQPGGWRSGTGQQSGRTLHPAVQSGSRSGAGSAEPLAATAASLFGLSPDNQ